MIALSKFIRLHLSSNQFFGSALISCGSGSRQNINRDTDPDPDCRKMLRIFKKYRCKQAELHPVLFVPQISAISFNHFIF